MKSRALIWFAVASSSAGIAAVLSGCPSFASDVGPFPDGGSDGASNDGAPSCDPSKDPSCVNDSSGIFVSAGGSDSNAGTKEAPVKTIGAAIAKTSSSKNAVYVCAGAYPEHVKISAAVNLYGGFACADWSYATTNKPKIAPSDAGYALDIESVSGAITVQDLEFDSIDGKNAGDSSIAIFVASSSNVALHRVTAVAGNGVAGGDAEPTSNYDGGTAPIGSSTTTDLGAGPCTNTCGDGTSTVGGNGGNGVLTGSMSTGGGDGGPSIPPNPAGFDGVGGAGKLAGCNGGDPGATAANADAGAASPQTPGELTASGWTSTHGSSGAAGGPAQGGGGGSGGAHATASNNGGGGGGGCGGCGGAGGAVGNSGGSSFALLIFQSTVVADTCTLTAANGGDGKAGGSGQLGQVGGNPGTAATFGCTGGGGGNGGAGAGGGGGAGGDTIAIGYIGTKPTVTAGSQQEGTAGGPGAGGTGGAGNNGLAGVAGTKADVQELP